MYRYYSTQRPVGPGTFPGRPENIVNFSGREDVSGIGPSWGYLEYREPLDDGAIEHYELKPASLKKFVVKVTTVHTLEVEAENEDKATEKACGMAWEYDAASTEAPEHGDVLHAGGRGTQPRGGSAADPLQQGRGGRSQEAWRL